MALPKAIQDQVDKADALQRQLAGDTAPTPTETPPTVAPAPAPAAPVTQTAPQGAPQASEDWEAKYRTLQGMFNSETARAAELNRQLTAQVASLNTKLGEMADRLMQLSQQPQQPAPTTPPEPVVDEAGMVETFGADMVDMARKIARGEMAKATSHYVNELRARDAVIQSLQQQLGTVATHQVSNAQDKFYETLDRSVSNWREVNVDQGWLMWLGQNDPLSGQPRQKALDAAVAAFDGTRAVAIFQAYLQAHPAPTSPAPNELTSQLTPGKSAGNPPPPTQPARPTKIWTAAEVTKFYDSWRRKEITDEQARLTEAEIDAAAAEGRIRG